MKEQRISFPTAKLAKAKGFSEPCSIYYTFSGLLVKVHDEQNLSNDSRFPTYNAATQALLQKWLREVHNIHVTSIIAAYTSKKFRPNVVYFSSDLGVCDYMMREYDTYEEAMEAGLLEALNLI